MPSIFPELYNYSHIAPFLLRLAIGVFFIASGIKSVFGLTTLKTLGVLEILYGIFFLIGLFVQPAAIAAAIILLTEIIFKFRTGFGGIYGQTGFRFFLLAVLLSLIVLGPGIFSFDLPL